MIFRWEQKENFLILDFDGVIKDSVGVKSDAFEQLFSPFGKEIAKKIRKHHEENCGMSRYEKLPIYLSWAGEIPDSAKIMEYSEKFSALVKENVINSQWMPGSREFIMNKSKVAKLFLITATPQVEIEEIIGALGIKQYFIKVIGAPISKSDAVEFILHKYSVHRHQTVMVGDSLNDYRAAIDNNLSFILFKNAFNKSIQKQLDCCMIDNFYG